LAEETDFFTKQRLMWCLRDAQDIPFTSEIAGAGLISFIYENI
jgi:hypothetical protein